MSRGMFNDVKVGVDVIKVLNPAAYTTDQTINGIDIKGYVGVALFVVQFGAITGTTTTLAITAQEGNLVGGGDAVAIPATELDGNSITGPDETGDNQVLTLRVNVHRDKRYLTFFFDLGGTTPNYTMGALILLPGKQFHP